MTGFAGFFVRDEAAPPPEALDRIRARIRGNLSRSAHHHVAVHDDGRVFLAQYDNGAWQAGRTILDCGDGIAVISGDPIVVTEGGTASAPAQSAALVADALSGERYDALAGTAGGFAALRWLARDGTLKLCADKLAQRPIYVRMTPGLCQFATTLRVLRSMSDVGPRLDETGLGELVFLGDCLAGRTIFEDIRLVPPGSVMEVTSTSAGTVNYHRWDDVPPCRDAPEAIVQRLHALFDRAVRRRVRGATSVDAFLTGGMDSRSVVAGLLDAGVQVRAFNYSYPASADAVLGRMVADRLGVELTVRSSRPEDRVKLDGDLFALNARDHFPRGPRSPGDGARLIWSGDGGSVGLGHVYMTAETVAAAAGTVDDDVMKKLFSRLDVYVTRTISRPRQDRLRSRARESVRAFFAQLRPSQPDRRLFLYYLLNDQSRHLHGHYEHVDISDIEFETPFFDMDFLAYVVSCDTGPFLYHRLYNAWLGSFHVPAADVPWQAYPGHEPGPLPLPEGILGQWSTDWYGGRVGAAAVDQALTAILRSGDGRVRGILDRAVLLLLLFANRAGMHRFNYEGHFARQIFERITGRSVFASGAGK